MADQLKRWDGSTWVPVLSVNRIVTGGECGPTFLNLRESEVNMINLFEADSNITYNGFVDNEPPISIGSFNGNPSITYIEYTEVV